MTKRPLLLLAHPGHEFRLFRWMEREMPLVCVLSDGSGGAGTARHLHSRDLVRQVGATPGRCFGPLPDRAWYAAILAGDATPFRDAARLILAEAEHGAAVVADPVEGYNPLHDLCAALADGIAARLGSRRLTFALTCAAGSGADRLDAAARARKEAALLAYAPLASEAATLLAADPAALEAEEIRDARFDWPADAPEPAYEATGRARQAAGAYRDVITYARHVRPLAMTLRA